MADTGATVYRWLVAGEFRAFPMRFVLAGLAIAIGVALAFAVHIINRSAAESFGQAVRSAAGGADLQVRGASALGFDEQLYPKLMALSVVADASPVVQLRATIGEPARPILLLGLDIFRTQTVSPSLIIRPQSVRTGGGTQATELDAILDPNALYLSRDAMTQTGLDVGHRVDVHANGRTHNFVVGGRPAGRDARAGAGSHRHRFGAMALRTPRRARSCRFEARTRGPPLLRPRLSLRRSSPVARSSAMPTRRAGAATRCRAPIVSTLTCSPWSRC